MKNFKIVYPGGYNILNIDDDNIDLNVVFPNNSVFFATFFTVSNIQKLMDGANSIYFWSTDMVIVKNLKKETIQEAILKIINDEYFGVSFSKIGLIEDVYPGKKEYKEIVDSI